MTPRARPPGSRLDDLTEPDILDVIDGDGESLFLRGQALARELQVHRFAIQELRTKLSVLRDEVSLLDDHNPIEHLSHRVKSPTSIVEKLRRKELPITLLTAPIGFETLATRIWADAEAVFLAEAALASIVLVALSGVLTWLVVVRRSDRLA